MELLNSFLLVIIFSSTLCQAAITDYISGVKQYFGLNPETRAVYKDDLAHIPFEVADTDEKFIQEASKLTGIALSELDTCQQRVVLKLKADCHKMNDEQQAKMAVHLLNCQSYVEGRQIYPCTDEMSIKDCTTKMDSDTWTSYHLMSNRAKAVCYTIRQSQFRGLAEHTVNRLMDAARDQLSTLKKISDNQEDLQNIVDTTYNTLEKGQETLSQQQQDLQRATFHGQLALEDNINRLVEEKRLIMETHNQLIKMTKNVQTKLELSTSQMETQSEKTRLNHQQLINDLSLIQTKTFNIFQKIDESAQMLIEQNENFKRQYELTLKNLAEVNASVHNLMSIVGGTRRALEERLSWITTVLGDTDLAVERLYLILWHSVFILLAMLSCAFLTLRRSTRIVVVALPSLNLAVAFQGEHKHLDALSMTILIASFELVQMLVWSALELRKSSPRAIAWIQEKLTPKKTSPTNSIRSVSSSSSSYTNETVGYNSRFTRPYFPETEDGDTLGSLTPPLSRIAASRSRSNTPLTFVGKSNCLARTRAGTPCKLSAISGRDFCHRHQTGGSVMGSI